MPDKKQNPLIGAFRDAAPQPPARSPRRRGEKRGRAGPNHDGP